MPSKIRRFLSRFQKQPKPQHLSDLILNFVRRETTKNLGLFVGHAGCGKITAVARTLPSLVANDINVCVVDSYGDFEKVFENGCQLTIDELGAAGKLQVIKSPSPRMDRLVDLPCGLLECESDLVIIQDPHQFSEKSVRSLITSLGGTKTKLLITTPSPAFVERLSVADKIGAVVLGRQGKKLSMPGLLKRPEKVALMTEKLRCGEFIFIGKKAHPVYVQA